MNELFTYVVDIKFPNHFSYQYLRIWTVSEHEQIKKDLFENSTNSVVLFLELSFFSGSFSWEMVSQQEKEWILVSCGWPNWSRLSSVIQWYWKKNERKTTSENSIYENGWKEKKLGRYVTTPTGSTMVSNNEIVRSVR